MLGGVLYLAGVHCARVSQTAGDIQIPAVFGSSMVWPAEQVVPMSGSASAFAEISVLIGGQPTLRVSSDADGKWQAEVPPLPVSLTPTNVTISSSKQDVADVILEDVLVGSIYICSGENYLALTFDVGLIVASH